MTFIQCKAPNITIYIYVDIQKYLSNVKNKIRLEYKSMRGSNSNKISQRNTDLKSSIHHLQVDFCIPYKPYKHRNRHERPK